MEEKKELIFFGILFLILGTIFLIAKNCKKI